MEKRRAKVKIKAKYNALFEKVPKYIKRELLREELAEKAKRKKLLKENKRFNLSEIENNFKIFANEKEAPLLYALLHNANHFVSADYFQPAVLGHRDTKGNLIISFLHEHIKSCFIHTPQIKLSMLNLGGVCKNLIGSQWKQGKLVITIKKFIKETNSIEIESSKGIETVDAYNFLTTANFSEELNQDNPDFIWAIYGKKKKKNATSKNSKKPARATATKNNRNEPAAAHD